MQNGQTIQQSHTSPELMPVPIDVSEQTGINPEVLAQEGLVMHDLAKAPGEIDLQSARELDPESGDGMIGILELGGKAVKVYGSMTEHGPVAMLTASDYEERTEENIDHAQKRNFVFVQPGEPVIVGRSDARKAAALGLKDNQKVSRNHFSVELSRDGRLAIRDLESTNGTKLITAEADRLPEQLPQETVHEAGAMATKEVVEVPASKEVVIGDISFHLDGAIASTSREAYAFTTTDKQGQIRRMFVYRSGSEGALRVSPGIEKYVDVDGKSKERYLKGAETSRLHQYTQESQLNPQFAEALEGMISGRSDMQYVTDEHLKLTAEGAEAVRDDFEANIDVAEFANEAVARDLLTIKSNNFGRIPAELAFNQLPGSRDLGKEFLKYVDILNADLEQSGLIPNFGEPVRTETDNHPTLGEITREVFQHFAGSARYEWHMASDTAGRVWIDRIRNADSPTTVYGTDKDLVYSGILTSKPIDHPGQTEALPEDMVKGIDGTKSYKDISAFLDTFAPIQRYRAARHVTRK